MPGTHQYRPLPTIWSKRWNCSTYVFEGCDVYCRTPGRTCNAFLCQLVVILFYINCIFCSLFRRSSEKRIEFFFQEASCQATIIKMKLRRERGSRRGCPVSTRCWKWQMLTGKKGILSTVTDTQAAEIFTIKNELKLPSGSKSGGFSSSLQNDFATPEVCGHLC